MSFQSSCDSDAVSISWAASQGSVAYMAVAENRKGHRVTCNTTQMTCDVSGLQCGQTYELYVFGVDGDCIGTRSEVRILETGETSNGYSALWVRTNMKYSKLNEQYLDHNIIGRLQSFLYAPGWFTLCFF